MPLFQYINRLSMHKDLHYEYKTVARPSYLDTENPCLYWQDRAVIMKRPQYASTEIASRVVDSRYTISLSSPWLSGSLFSEVLVTATGLATSCWKFIHARDRSNPLEYIMCTAWRQKYTISVRWSPDFSTMTSSNGNISRVAGHLSGEFTGHRSPSTKTSDAELWCFLWSASK